MAHFPITLFASVMGMTGLSIAFQRIALIYPSIDGVGLTLFFVAVTIFIIISGLYTWKIVKYPDETLKEFNHPVRFNFFPAVTISLLLLSIASMELFPAVAKGLWVVGTAGHLIFTLTAVSRWIGRLYSIQQFNPVWFIPVVGNVLVPIAGVEFFSREISWFFFSVGMVFWLALFSIMVYRLGFHGDLPAKLVPTLFILIAPPAVGFISYVKLTGQFDATARVLLYVAMFIAMLLAVMFRTFARTPFFLSWWAYTFPLCAMSIALTLAYRMSQIECFAWLAALVLATATVVTGLVSIKTVGLILEGKLCVPEE